MAGLEGRPPLMRNVRATGKKRTPERAEVPDEEEWPGAYPQHSSELPVTRHAGKAEHGSPPPSTNKY